MVINEGTESKTLYRNKDFAAAISMKTEPAKPELGSAGLPYQVRTQEQLENADAENFLVYMAEGRAYPVYLKQTYDIPLDNTYQSITILEDHVYDGGARETYTLPGYRIKNARNTIFAENNGTITNCYVENLTVEEKDEKGIAGFVITNNGKISDCGIYGSSVGTEGSALSGLARYAQVSVTGHKAYGFAVTNEKGASITNCFVTGNVNAAEKTVTEGNSTVTHPGEAAGFVGVNNGQITNSYANCHVMTEGNDGKSAGFAMSSINTGSGNPASVSQCYSVGSVKAEGVVYGFAESAGKTEHSYTLSEIKINPDNNVTEYYGFTRSNVSNENCYMGYDEKQQYNTDENIITTLVVEKTLEELKAMNDYVAYQGDDVPYTTTKLPDYPYPAVGIAHYGDWPEAGKEVSEIVENIEKGFFEDKDGNYKDTYMGIFYYEKYPDGKYGVYAVGDSEKITGATDGEGRRLIWHLAKARPEGSKYGYGIFYYGYEDRPHEEPVYIKKVNDEEFNEAVEIESYIKNQSCELITFPFRAKDGEPLDTDYKFYIFEDIEIKTVEFVYKNKSRTDTITVDAIENARPQ